MDDLVEGLCWLIVTDGLCGEVFHREPRGIYHARSRGDSEILVGVENPVVDFPLPQDDPGADARLSAKSAQDLGGVLLCR